MPDGHVADRVATEHVLVYTRNVSLGATSLQNLRRWGVSIRAHTRSDAGPPHLAEVTEMIMHSVVSLSCVPMWDSRVSKWFAKWHPILTSALQGGRPC